MQKLSGKRNEFGRRSGEQLELYRRSNLSGKRTEADIYATFMSVSVFCNFGDFFVTCIAKTLPRIYLSLRAITAVTAVCGGKRPGHNYGEQKTGGT